jgi:hypothetical protein
MLADFSSSLLEGIGLKILLSILFLLAGLALAKLRDTLPSRRLWRLDDPSRVVISVAHSTASHTGKYLRPATGIGQVRALALLMPSLRRAYSDLEIRNIYLSSESLLDRLECDLICLGGVKNNKVTEDVLDHLGDRCPLSMKDSEIFWTEQGETEAYEGAIDNGQVVRDFGLIVRTENPFNSKDKRTVVILAGSHTYGTIAAARYFCAELGSPFRRQPRSFAALVESEVRDGYPASPRLLKLAEIG